MRAYNPDKFRSLFITALGGDLWQFLNEDRVLARLIAFSEADKPAVQGIEELLLERFGDAVCADRVKQMIGHMIRQVMEAEGWVVDQQNVNVFSVPFIKATRYRRADRCGYFVFRNAADPRDLCLVRSRSADLPADEEGVKWRYWTRLTSPLRAAIVFDLCDLTSINTEIDAKGHFRFHHRRAVRAA